jgi:hypothetical protein
MTWAVTGREPWVQRPVGWGQRTFVTEWVPNWHQPAYLQVRQMMPPQVGVPAG